ncbi:MAG: hypothetical protein U9R25_05500 [Chloroflexota bacterium]|nr:hypothetical protein [Chloroflexota bacterium]
MVIIHLHGDSNCARPGCPSSTIYIRVEGIKAKARLAEEAGGLVVIPPEEVVPVGSKICLFNEPSGVTLAMLEHIK